MRVRSTIVAACLVVASIANAEDSAVASVDISEVSGVITLAEGLYFLDAYEYYTAGGGTQLISDSGESIGTALYTGNNQQAVTSNTILSSGSILSTEEDVVFLNVLGKGTKIIARASRGDDVGQVTQMDQVAFADGVVLIYLEYNIQRNPNVRRYAVARITGDWEALGINLPSATPSLDLNQDGIVNGKDLLIFQAAWGTAG